MYPVQRVYPRQTSGKGPVRPGLRLPLLLTILLPLLSVATLQAQQSVGTIAGHVRGRLPGSVSDLRILLVELESETVMMESSPEADGSFLLRDVPYARYRLRLALDSTVLAERLVTVASSVPVAVTIDSLPLYRTGGVIVRAEPDRNRTGTHTFYTAETISNLPVSDPEKGIETILLNTPGVVPDEDGRMHVRGEDAQLQYVIDGIPVTANMTRVYSSLFDAGLVKSVDLETGGLNAEYGRATAAVLAINTRSGFDRPFFAHASGSAGSFDTRGADLELGGTVGGRVGLYGAISRSRSGRYLDPIAAGDPIHSDGEAIHYFGKANVVITDAIDLSILGSYNTTRYQVPNGRVRIPAQDQQQDLSDYLVGGRLGADLDADSRISLVGYVRHARAAITSGGLMRITTSADSIRAVQENEKFFFGGERLNDVRGAQIEYGRRADWFGGTNHAKIGAGGESYPLREFFTFAVVNPALSTPDSAGGDIRYRPYDLTQGGTPFLVDEQKTGRSFFAYVQDQLLLDQWTINAGLRYDLFDLLKREQFISPRLSAAYQWNSDLVLRGSYGFVAMQAPVENILVSSSQAARTLTGAEQGDVPTVVGSEQAHSMELGASWRLNDFVALDLAGYGKLIENFIVKVELGNSGVIFPVNLKEGVVAGGELRAELHDWNNLSGFLSVGSGVALGMKPEDGSSPIAAGLILGEEGENYSHPFAGEDVFPTEHNQLVTAAMNLSYHHSSGLFATLGGRFDSGLPFDLTDGQGRGLTPEESRTELRRRGYSDDVIDLLALEMEEPGSPDKSVAPHAIFDVAAGIDLFALTGLHARIIGTVTNVFDTPYLYKFESSFGGTHYGLPRMFSLRVEAGL